MYEQFGPIVDHATRTVQFKLFFPDNAKDTLQYGRGGLPRILEIAIPGTFHTGEWDTDLAPRMTLEDHPSGILYTYSTRLQSDGFYQYKFFVKFENGDSRWVNDPCTRYGAHLDGNDNSGFVVGGGLVAEAQPIANRVPPQSLVIYEMMIDDYVSNIPEAAPGSHTDKNKLEVVLENIDRLTELGVNALQPMPWTSVPGTGFNWGYEPFLFFSVDERLTDRPGTAPSNNVNRLFSLRELIDALHQRNINIILDGVFNHAREEFPYLQLYQNKEECPYIGFFVEQAFFEDIDFSNGCAREFILDVCKYWLDIFKIDGIRFDYVRGFFDRSSRDEGIKNLIASLRQYLKSSGNNNFSFILENLPDNRFQAIDDANKINATSTWFDPLMFEAFNSGKDRQIRPSMMRRLNSSKDFAEDKGPLVYIENHDHGTLVNKVGGNFVGVDRAKNWFVTQPYTIALMTIPGSVLIHNGQEFGDEYYIDEKNDRVNPRPLRWNTAEDFPGRTLRNLYKKLIQIRKDFPGLQSSEFHPDNYNESFTRFDANGFGIDTERQIIIFHRWGPANDGNTERFVIVLNFSSDRHFVDVPFPFNGTWTDLLTEEAFPVTDFVRRWQDVNSHCGRIFHARG